MFSTVKVKVTQCKYYISTVTLHPAPQYDSREVPAQTVWQCVQTFVENRRQTESYLLFADVFSISLCSHIRMRFMFSGFSFPVLLPSSAPLLSIDFMLLLSVLMYSWAPEILWQ